MIPFRPDLTRRMAGGADANSYHGRQMAPPPVAMAPPARLTTIPSARAPGIMQAVGNLGAQPTAAPAPAPMVAQAPVAAPMVAAAPQVRPGQPFVPPMGRNGLMR